MSADGTSRAVLEYRRMMLEAHGLDPELAESMTGTLRTQVAVEVRQLAREKGATPPEPEGDGEADSDDPAVLRRRYGRRRY